MEVIEIISHYIDKTQNLINVEFKMMGDDDDILFLRSLDMTKLKILEYLKMFWKKMNGKKTTMIILKMKIPLYLF